MVGPPDSPIENRSEPDKPGAVIERPEVFTTGARVTAAYKSLRGDELQTAHGFIVRDDNDFLVIEEYDIKTVVRENEHRHIILDMSTMDVYSQTDSRTQKLGLMVDLRLVSPPWESQYDQGAHGCLVRAVFGNLDLIREDIYEFVDPDQLDKPEGWSRDTHDPSQYVPRDVEDKNWETVYTPNVDLDNVAERREEM